MIQIMKKISAFFTPRRCLWIVCAVAVASTAYIALGLHGQNEGDVAWYQWMIHDWAAGNLPYLTHPVEYPPYALGVFALPWLLGDANYLLNFMLLALAIDIAIKALLLYAGRRECKGRRAYLPLFLYSVTVPFISYFYLQRFDLWPALIALLAVLVFSGRRYILSGFMLAVGIGDDQAEARQAFVEKREPKFTGR